jgi:hypothetical protein
VTLHEHFARRNGFDEVVEDGNSRLLVAMHAARDNERRQVVAFGLDHENAWTRLRHAFDSSICGRHFLWILIVTINVRDGPS